MKKSNRNIRVLAENNNGRSGFSIYLDFSGQREYLMHHRYNGLLYAMLKDGVAIEDVYRLGLTEIRNRGFGRKNSVRLCERVCYLSAVINEYLQERETC